MMNDTVATHIDHKIITYYLGVPIKLSPEQEAFRAAFDPKFGVNEAHVTLVAPFPAGLMTQELDEFFAHTLVQFKQQELVAQGYHITPRGHIFYMFDPASAVLLIQLYDALYEHPLLHNRKNISRPFLPHATIAKFASAHAVPQEVESGLSALCARRTVLFDRVRLYAILDVPGGRMHVNDYYAEKCPA